MRARLLVACFVWFTAAAAAPAEPVRLEAAPVELVPGRPEVRQVGRLQWRGGLHLKSPDRRFGGYSGLERLPDGRLVAVSDLGHWLVFRPVFDMDGRLVGAIDGEIEPLKDEAGRPFKRKLQADAESLRRERDGGFLIGFERDHRLLRYAAPGAPGKRVDAPADLASQPGNGGIESIAAWPDGRILLISELARSDGGDLKAWLRARGQWHELTYVLSGEHQPTDAVVLPSGDLLVLERRYGLFASQGARVIRVPAQRVVPAGRLYGEVLADWEPSMTVDNMEAMAIGRGPRDGPDAGAVLLWLMSDDNKNPLQRTLLMLFRIE